MSHLLAKGSFITEGNLLVMLYLIVSLALPVSGMTTPEAQTPFYVDKTDLLYYLDAEGHRHPIVAAAQWPIRRAHILANMQLVMGELPDASRRVPLEVQVTEEVEMEHFTRRKVTFAVEPGDRVPAYLLLPKGFRGQRPAMLCLHQTIAIGKAEMVGLGDNPNRRYGLELAERGYVVLAPDYPNFGEYQIDVYSRGYVSATMKGIWNHMRAVDLLQSLPAVDPKRIGVIGHSLGGHNSLYLAVFDERIRAVVTSCGFNSFAKYYGGDLTGWSHNGYMPRIASVYGKDPARMPFDFTEVLGALAPRPVFINAPLGDTNFEVSGVYDCVKAARPVYALLGAPEALVAVHPDCGHDFPPEIREQAYAFLDRTLADRG
ncbi:MAG: alpha/beta hydrolase [Candidatus Zipacnadales bacterium]